MLPAASPPAADPRHFARAVTELGERRPVHARTAIYNAQGLKIIDKGVAIDSRLYERLTQHQLKLPLHECLDSDPAVSAQSLRDDALQVAVHDRFCAAMLTDLRGGEAMLDELALVPLPRAIAFQLTVLRESHPRLWQHALRSALTAAWLGARTGLTRYDQRFLAAGGLLHDLGMLHIDPVLLRPQVRLSREQRRQLYAHPLISAMLLEQCTEYPAELVRAVLEHHEAADGSGYPKGNPGSETSPWGRILALTETVTGVTADGRDAPALRLSLALRMTAPRHDPALCREVLRLVAPLREVATPPTARPDGDPLADLHRMGGLYPRWRHLESIDDPRVRTRKAVMARIAELCDTGSRALAACGAASLNPSVDAIGAEDAAEWALIAREAAWQLRAVTRQARRRWRLAAGETFPEAVEAWLEEADALCGRWLDQAGDQAR